MKVGFDSKFLQTCMRERDNKTQVGEKITRIIFQVNLNHMSTEKFSEMKIAEFCP